MSLDCNTQPVGDKCEIQMELGDNHGPEPTQNHHSTPPVILVIWISERLKGTLDTGQQSVTVNQTSLIKEYDYD